MNKTPAHTWIGLAIIFGGQALLATGSSFMATWLTPVMWTGLILLLDGIVYRMRGRSWLMTRRREFPLLILASVAVWLVFEAYNLHLMNWRYEGLPESSLVRDTGYFWSFATIIPGVFEIVDLVQALMDRAGKERSERQSTAPTGPSWAWWLAGIAMVTIPLAVPADVAAYLFGAVFIGFFLLLDPLNEKLGLPSLRKQWRLGPRRMIWALLLGGLISGFVWETWNQQAVAAGGAYWVYLIPEELRPFGLTYGQMPLLGMLGFPPFVLELFAFYYFIRESLGGDRIFGVRPVDG
ncbi:MAG: hypothetical protein BMS9Abin28_1764 [Anaerolineae bacterium]|nr:MAG: hypothetical protein BMS9Abin28_1764 [Anaerolineae bacterium]